MKCCQVRKMEFDFESQYNDVMILGKGKNKTKTA